MNRGTRPRGRVLVAVVTCAVIVLAGCTAARPRADAAPAPTQAAFPAEALVPRPCTDTPNWDAVDVPPERRRRIDVRCSTLTVPLDHADRQRGTLEIAVVRVRARDQVDRIGSLILNPGGPGVSGLDRMPGWVAWLPDELLTRFDLVSFDPRGTGASSPLRCGRPDDLDTAPVPDMRTETGFAAGKELLRERASACADVLAERAGPFGTDAVARDLDLLREALGDRRTTYVGWSYGARLGAQYAHLFPDRVRALVLDAPPHPTASWREVIDAQITGFETAFASYATGCPTRDSCGLVAGDPRGVLARLVRSARIRPVPSGRPAGDAPATWDVVLRAVLGFLAAPELWSDLDAALSEADRGDSGSLYDMVDSLEGRTPAHPDADTDDAMQVVLCTDTAAGGDIDDVRAEARDFGRAHPTFGEIGAWWLFACSAWTAPRVPLPPPDTTTTAPLLVVGTTADPATPFGGAVALADVLGPRGVLLRSAGAGHSAFGRSDCVGRHVVRYLLDVDPPPRGTVCPST